MTVMNLDKLSEKNSQQVILFEKSWNLISLIIQMKTLPIDHDHYPFTISDEPINHPVTDR